MKVEIGHSVIDIGAELSCRLKELPCSLSPVPTPILSLSPSPSPNPGGRERILFDASLRRTRSSRREKVRKNLGANECFSLNRLVKS